MANTTSSQTSSGGTFSIIDSELSEHRATRYQRLWENEDGEERRLFFATRSLPYPENSFDRAYGLRSLTRWSATTFASSFAAGHSKAGMSSQTIKLDSAMFVGYNK